MCNSFKSVQQIINKNASILLELKNRQYYYAHIDGNNGIELLEEHQTLVNNYFVSICEALNLDRVINDLINSFVDDCFLGKCSIETKLFIKDLFCDTIIFHDFGKINENFQADPEKMNNQFFKNKKSPITTNHSSLSEYLFIAYHLSKIPEYTENNIDKFLLVYSVFSLSYPIAKHHASALLKQSEEVGFNEELVAFLSQYIEKFGWNIPEPFKSRLPERKFLETQLLNRVWELHKDMQTEFPLYALIKLCFSLLTASDYLATTHYMSGWTKMYNEYGVLNNEQKERIVFNLRNSQIYNKALYDNLETFELICPQEKSNKNLNRLRSEMAIEVIRNIRANAYKRLFYIEAPTGGGKTNLSMIALAELMEHDLVTGGNNINKIFYVFPFTTLITQTYGVLEKTLGLEESEIIELHSKAGFKENESEDEYGKNNKCYLDGLFVNYPVVVTSHIKFFDILTTSHKETNYLLHHVANSIVIIDELQSYSPEQWDKLIYLIDNYSEHFNIKFILMSATLPKIGKLTWNEKIPDFVYLINDKDKYFQNKNFKDRVHFDFSLLKWDKPKSREEKKEIYLPKLSTKLFAESFEYAQNTGNVFTIIEFIFKRTASDFYKIADKNNNGFFDKIYVLSGAILEPRRKEIIEFIKDEHNRNKNILLITTQVVEAGVDIDMDIGFKDKSLVDSDEQLAGRINRNVNKGQCTLFIFDCDDASFIYGTDIRYKFIQQSSQEEYSTILTEKSFDKVYNKVIDDRKKHNEGMMNIGLSDFRKHMQDLSYIDVEQSFELIKGQNYSVFVQLDIPIFIPGTEKQNFTKYELTFLSDNGKYLNGDVFVSGEKVWELYSEIIKSKSDDFVEQKIRMKKIQGILSKFTFSIFSQSKDAKNLIELGYKDDDLGFIRLFTKQENQDDIYNYESGLDDNSLNGAIIL